MLNWLGGRQEHPMADLKQVRELVATLPHQDPVRALEDIALWLESLAAAGRVKLQRRLEVIDLLDQTAKPYWYRLAPEYLDAPRLQKFYENRLWNALFGFWTLLGNAYLQCIEEFQAGVPGAEAVEKSLPLITGRALRSLALQLKWLLLRYDLIPDRVWRDLGRACLFAESRGIVSRRAVIYPGMHGESSAHEEFVKALMFAMSAPESLAPARLQIAERIVAHFGGRFLLAEEPSPGCCFFFDLAMHKAPGRVRRSMRPGTMGRFFGPGAARQALDALAGEINRKDGVLVDVNLGGAFEKEIVLSVLAHLKSCWSDKAPARGAERRELATRVTVLPGFAPSLRWIEAVMDENSLEFSDPESAESWIVFNMSDTGFGAIVPKVRGDWVQVGKVLGLRTETSNVCRIGVVRRVTRDQYGQRRIGVEVLGKLAVPVQFARAGVAGAVDPGGQWHPGLLFSSKPDRKGEIAVLLRAGGYSYKHDLHMRVRGGTYLLAPAELVEAGEDFDRARFRAVKQMVASADTG